MILLAGIIGAISDSSREKQADSEATEETTEEAAEEASEPSTEETFPPKDPRPAPQTPEERVHRNIEDVFTLDPSEGSEGLEDLQIQNRGDGCIDAYVAFEGSGFFRDWSADSIESQMQQVYEAAYSDDELRKWVCTVRTSASGVLTDDRGNETKDTLYTTSMSGEVADSVNWGNTWDVNFPNVWTTEYTHPALEQQEAQDAASQLRDCLDDGGFFDFDWAECP